MSLIFEDSTFEKLARSLGDIFPEILNVFIKETELSLEELTNSITNEQWQLAKDTSHKLKSSLKTFGAVGLVNQLEQLEMLVINDKKIYEKLLNNIQQEYLLVKEHISSK